MATLKSSGQLQAYLAKTLNATAGAPCVRVGFLADRHYPSGVPVATIAAIQEFGSPANNIPSRPFFRRMIAEKSPGWPDTIAKQYKATGGDVPNTLYRMGQGIQGQLKQSIRDLTDPPLSPKTIAARSRKTKGKAAPGWGGLEKPLIDTSLMLDSVDFVVDP